MTAKKTRRPAQFVMQQAFAAHAEASRKTHARAEKSLALRQAGKASQAKADENKVKFWLRKMLGPEAHAAHGEPEGGARGDSGFAGRTVSNIGHTEVGVHAMQTFHKSSLVFISALAVAGLAYAQPPDVVTSDLNGNTAMGTDALLPNQSRTIGNTASGFQALMNNMGQENTASGYQALMNNTMGEGNTASGYQALGLNTTGYDNVAYGLDALFDNTTGSNNAAFGFGAMEYNTTGNNNTAIGYEALALNMTGAANTALGWGALDRNSTGNNNTASGGNALNSNSTGSYNTASGFEALYSNTTGGENTASGVAALQANTTGNGNSAAGFRALFMNTSGAFNTAFGYSTLFNNTTGTENNAAGYGTLQMNTTGSYNNAMGVKALYENTTGSQNSAVGYGALYSNTGGNYNVALGLFAGYYLTTGSNNIDISNLGVAGESGVIRIGIQGTQGATYVAGIYGTPMTGSAVVISASGRLGVIVSSERLKTDIAPMGPNSAKLQQLRPVTFHLKTDPNGALQYGLIAEEVAKVYPELVIRNESGRIDGVRYDELAPMLLNEVQQQAAEIRDLKQQQKIVGEMQKQLAEMHAVLLKLQTTGDVVAQR